MHTIFKTNIDRVLKSIAQTLSHNIINCHLIWAEYHYAPNTQIKQNFIYFLNYSRIMNFDTQLYSHSNLSFPSKTPHPPTLHTQP